METIHDKMGDEMNLELLRDVNCSIIYLDDEDDCWIEDEEE